MNHIIKKQTLTIDIPSGYDTWRMQDSFKEVFNRDVLPRLEKVCDELGLDKRVSLKLDKLTIDTGTISSRELTSTWADEIENQFRKELLSRQQEKLNDEQLKSLTNSNQSELEAFIHFLETGVLPWWVSDEFSLNPEQLLEKLLSEQPKELVSQIGKSKSKSSISKRLLYQFEPEQLKQLLKHFTQPETNQVLNSFQSICARAFKTIPKPLQTAFLAAEIASNIDQNLIKNDTEKLFEFLFTHIKTQQSGSDRDKLSEIHKTLTNNIKTNKNSLSLKEQKSLSIALRVISRLSGSQEESKEKPVASADQTKTAANTDKTAKADPSHKESKSFGSTDSQLKTRPTSGKPEAGERSPEPDQTTGEHNITSQKTQSAAGNLNDELADSDQTNPAYQENFNDPNKSERPSDKTSTSSPLDEPLSAQDKRAWEQIERIKKLQLARLNQEKKNEIITAKPDASSAQGLDNSPKDHKESPSPSQASETWYHKDQSTENEAKIKPEHESNNADSTTRASEPLNDKSQSIEAEPWAKPEHQSDNTDPTTRASEPLHNKSQSIEAEPWAKPEHKSNNTDPTTQAESGSESRQKDEGTSTLRVKEEAKAIQRKGQKPAKQNNTEQKLAAGKQAPEKKVNLSEQREAQTRADTGGVQNTANKPGPEVLGQAESINPEERTDKAPEDNTIVPEPLEETTLIQYENGNQTHQRQASDQQGSSSAKAESNAEKDHSEKLRADKPGQHNSLSPVKQVSRKPDQNTLAYWQEELESIDECYIQNAGLILFWPYLGHFFKDMGLTTDRAFQSDHNQQQAALLLQYLLSPDPELHEYRLPLNKLLCGLKISEPVGRSIDLTEEDLTRCNNLLEAAIQNWSALRGTSVEGFQSSFLQRNGVLKRKDKHWLLQVEKMPFDMLMEQLPWPIGIVRLSWMNKPIYVEW